MLTDFHNCFTARKRTKFTTKFVSKFSLLLKYVATHSTLPCEMETFENNTNCAKIQQKFTLVIMLFV